MNREGISSVRRVELLAHLERLEQQIEAQTSRVRHAKSKGWNVHESETLLKTLQESRDLYRSALGHLLGHDVPGFRPD